MLRLITAARLFEPLYLLLAALTYFVGAGIARYLGTPTDLSVLAMGLLGVLLAQASMGLLAAVFRTPAQPIPQEATPVQQRTVRSTALYLAMATMSGAALIALVLHWTHALTTSAAVTIGMSLVLIVVFAVPPMRGQDRGFGGLLHAVQVAYLSPSIGFLLQAGGHHRLLNATVIALTALLLGTLVALEFPSYAADLQRDRSTLLTRMGWRNGLRLHHSLVAAGYLLLASTALLGFSLQLFLPAFLSIPFALLQVYMLSNIALGAKPIWNLLRANAVAAFGLAAYFLALSFWLS